MFRIALGTALVSLVVGLGVAGATTHIVPPGPGTPIQDAIDAAAPGDTIRLLIGEYDEKIVVTKALKIRGVRSRSPSANDTTMLKGDCGTGPVITVAADDVLVRGILVNFDNEGGVDVVGRTHVKLKDIFVASNCSTVTRPAFNVDQSTRVTMDHIWAAAFNTRPLPTFGVRIANTPQSGRVRLRTSITGGYDAGVLLESNEIVSVRVSTSYINGSTRGVLFQNTSRAIVDHNHVQVNAASGIEIDAGSSGNLILRNQFDGNGTDVVDNGASNCWRNNVYTTGTVPACP
jgi:nitrous oxidase accessory protein NosD